MPKQASNSPSRRKSRPVDLIAAPAKKGDRPSLNGLPESFRVALTEAEEWPYVNPDDNGLADPEPTFGEYPSDPSLLPANVEPFSEDEPWGKMLTESPRNYELFSHYRAQGITRTMTATADHFQITRNHVMAVASDKNWQARVKAWDDYRERIYTAELILGVKEMAHLHAEKAREGIEALSVAFTGIVEAMNDEERRAEFLAEINDLPAKTQLALAQGTARVLPNLMNAERLSRGLPTEISHQLHQHEARVTIQTTDDLADIILGIAGPLAVARSGEPEEETVDAE